MDTSTIGGVPVIALISQGLKALGVPKRAIPFANMVLGIIWGLVTSDGPVESRVATGLLSGAAAGGIYDVVHKGGTSVK